MKKIVCLILFASVFLTGIIPFAHAGEIDILIDKLVQKGVLTPMEAQIIMDETKTEVAKQIAEAKDDALPTWIQKVKLKGDLRLRYQYERRQNDTEGRERGRIRFRLGLLTKPTDQFEVGAGLATGSADPRSTNQTMENFFETTDIRLDYAYAQYTHNQHLKVIAGKFPRKAYLWEPTDLLWDGDINPDGASMNLQGQLTANTEGFLNTGVWILDHKDQQDYVDPFMNYLQGGIHWKYDNMDLKLSSTYYAFHGLKNVIWDKTTSSPNNGEVLYSAGTNTTVGAVGSKHLKYDYDSVALGTEFGVREMFGGLPLHIDDRIAVFGQYVYNPDPSDHNTGWIAGIKFGNKKVKKTGNWQVKYQYAYLGKDSWLDILPDSDRYGGGTDCKSHEVAIKYALKKNVSLGLDYYYSDKIKSASNPEHILQADLSLKF